MVSSVVETNDPRREFGIAVRLLGDYEDEYARQALCRRFLLTFRLFQFLLRIGYL
jgi:hypothetical protein